MTNNLFNSISIPFAFVLNWLAGSTVKQHRCITTSLAAMDFSRKVIIATETTSYQISVRGSEYTIRWIKLIIQRLKPMYTEYGGTEYFGAVF